MDILDRTGDTTSRLFLDSGRRDPSPLWYDDRRVLVSKEPVFVLEGGSSHPVAEERMRGSRWVAVLSLGAASLTWTAYKGYFLAGHSTPVAGTFSLAEELGGLRLIEPRLTGGFAHAPCRAPLTSTLIPDPRCSELPQPGSRAFKRLSKAVRNIQNRIGSETSAAALRASAVLALLLEQDARGVDEAVAKFAKAAAATPQDPGVWSDLGAAHLVLGQRRDDPDELIHALEAVDRSLESGNSLPEARFNRALILEALSLTTPARDSWREFLKLDGGSAWAEEARDRLHRLERPPERSWEDSLSRLEEAALRRDRQTVIAIVASHRQAARERVEKVLLGEWAEAESRRDGTAGRKLDIARELGAALVTVGGERLAHDAVAAIDAALLDRDTDRLAALVAGHRALQDGLSSYGDGGHAQAVERFAASQEALRRAGSPFAARAAFYLACSEHRLERYDEASAILERLAGEIAGRPYWSLLGHIAWMQGLGRSVRNDRMGAIHEYERSFQRFEQAGEAGNVASVHVLLAEAFDLLGRHRKAWTHQYQALRAARTAGDPLSLYKLYAVAADAALSQGRPRIALYFQDEAVLQAQRLRDPQGLADALFWRGLMSYRAGRREQALQDLRSAREQIGRLPETDRRRSEADISLIEGELILASDPEEATRLFTSALEYYEETGHRFKGLMAYQDRFRARRLTGDLDGAEVDFKTSLEAYERIGAELSEEDLRLAFFNKTEEIFDEMISFQAERKRLEAAFTFADRARTRVLPGQAARTQAEGLKEADRSQLLTAEPAPMAFAEVRRKLPAGTSLVQFSVLPDRLLIWHVRRGEEVAFFTMPIGREALERRIGRLRASLERKATEEKAFSELFDLLVRPWMSEVQPGETVVFVPDKALQSMPFACLRNAATGRYLIEDFKVAIAPSATFYVSEPGKRERTRSVERRIPALVVANPEFDRDLSPGLPDLPESEAEAGQIARIVRGTVTIRGKAADKPSLLALAPRSTIFHFAGHAVTDPRDPLRSRLVLAAGGGDLHAWEVYRLDLSATQLVVLSACRTADAPLGDEGVANLARAFLAAGAPRVVASLWPVDDRVTARFFSEFYKSLLVHPDPVSALRDAQLSFLAGHEEGLEAPWAWGAFEIVGTNAHPLYATHGGN